MDASIFKTYAFVLTAALGYATATIGMKLAVGNAQAPGHWTAGAAALLAGGLLAAVFSEMTLMREVNLGALYLLIIAAESLVVLSYSFVIGEGLSLRDMFAGGLILTGVLMISE